jgi:hypothetical protein
MNSIFIEPFPKHLFKGQNEKRPQSGEAGNGGE